MKSLPRLEKEPSSSGYSQSSSGEKSENPDSEVFCTPQEDRLKNLNTALSTLGTSPFKFKSHHAADKSIYGQKKFISICETLKVKIENILNIDNLQVADIFPQKLYFDELMENVKQKITSLTYAEQITLLTLAPNSWTNQAASEYFGVPLSRV